MIPLKNNYMIRILFLAALLTLVFAGCDVRNKDKQAIGSTAKPIPSELTTVSIIDSSYDFGTITEGENVEYNFRFKNSGKYPLVVTEVSASCGCTVPEKPEQPIRPGETGFVKVKFNSDKRVGEARKTVTVISNASPAFPELILKGKVLPKNEN